MNSQLAFNISLSFAEIAKSLNKYLAPLLYEGTEEQDGQASMSLKVIREGDIEVSQKDEVLVIEADVHVWVKMHRTRGLLDLWKDIPGLRVEETDFNLQAKFYTTIQLTNDWKLESQTVGNFAWTRKPKVGLGLLNLNISQIVAPTLQTQIDIISDQIDDFILKEIDLPDKIQSIWEELCKPFKISDEWSSYFKLFSSQSLLNINGPFWNTQGIKLQITTNHLPEFYVQYVEPSFLLSKVPKLKHDFASKNISTKCHVNINLQDIVAYLAESPIEVSSNIHFVIRTASILVESTKYIIGLDLQIHLKNSILKGTFKAQVQLDIKVEQGDETQWIVLTLENYHLITSHYLLIWWDKFNHNALVDKLAEKLNSWLYEIQGEVLDQGENFLTGTAVHTNAYLSGKFLSIKPVNIMQSGNMLVLTLESDIEVNIQLIDF